MKIFIGQILAFCILFFICIIYNTIRNTYVIFLKDLCIFISIIFIIKNSFVFSIERSFNGLDKKDLIINILSKLGSINEIQHVVNIIFKFSILQIIVISILLFVFYITFYKNTFEVEIKSRFKLKLPNIQLSKKFFTKYKRSPFKSFILRDFIIMSKKKSFLSIQILFIMIFVFIAINFKKIPINLTMGFMICFVFLNSLLSQELFKADSKFKGIYLYLPIQYNTFILAKILCMSVLSSIIPLLLLFVQMLLGKINITSFFAIFITIILITLILSFYFCSIIIAFYPKINKTDLPLLISIILLFVLPGISLIFIYFGLKRGKSKWMKWEEIY
ncbi:ABC-2 transporter permease [Defluviitalea phaphyphila]|uniref:ABC-2 transporter permease n=1 Tax=Defluviitalea phaphyphila TaxID=1473580 RepID=UPI001A9A355B|nr:ABC-2 transporter permease [Defluviitalea phaphyphila]